MAYVDKITSQHRDKPKFRALVEMVSGCFAGATKAIQAIPPSFDLDTAVGAQLDVIGLWVGISRKISIPFAVYFSFDTTGLGWGEGSIKGPYDPAEGITSLDDETYRMLIRAKIGANSWDGTVGAWQTIIDTVFAGSGSAVFAVDNQDMSMDVYVSGTRPSALLSSLLKNGYLSLKPSGVKINGYSTPSITGSPFFGFDVSNQYVAGFGTGALAIPL